MECQFSIVGQDWGLTGILTITMLDFWVLHRILLE